MSVWGRLFAAGYDRVMAVPEAATFRAHRKALVGRASGSVLEIGGGTGANLPFYGPEVAELTITEPERPMFSRLEGKAATVSPAPALVVAPAEALPFEDSSFDAVVSTLVLCTVADQPRALTEIHRVLKTEGTLLFMEHVRARDERTARWQDRLNWLQRRVGHGCNCNRATADAIEAAGFHVTELRRDIVKKAPPIVRPLVVGVATANGRP